MERVLINEYRILSFDPGSRTLGMAVQDLNLETLGTTVIEYETLKVDRHIQEDDFNERLKVIQAYVTSCCKRYSPAAIAVELPYMGKRPQAFGALKEVLRIIKIGCHDWVPHCAMFFYEPSVIKKTVNVPGNSGDKNLMKKAMLSHPCISFSSSVDKDSMDEHAIDAVLIGYTHVHLGIKKKDNSNGQKKKTKRGKKK